MTGDDDETTAPRYENGTVRDEANVNNAVVTEQPAKPAAKADKTDKGGKPEPKGKG